MLQIVASLTDDFKGTIYDCNMFIVQATAHDTKVWAITIAIFIRLVPGQFSYLFRKIFCSLKFSSFKNFEEDDIRQNTPKSSLSWGLYNEIFVTVS